MANENNTPATATAEPVKVEPMNATGETILNTLTTFPRLVNGLKAYIDDLGTKSIKTAFFNGEKVKNQPLSILLHTSAGAIGDKFADKKTEAERLNVVLSLLRGKLTEDELKAEKLKTEVSAVFNTLKACGINTFDAVPPTLTADLDAEHLNALKALFA